MVSPLPPLRPRTAAPLKPILRINPAEFTAPRSNKRLKLAPTNDVVIFTPMTAHDGPSRMVAKWPYAAADKDIEYYQLKQKYNHKADVLAQRVETLTDELAKEQALHQATAEALAFEREHRMDPVLMERLQHEQEDHAHTKTRLDQLELQTNAQANENLTLRHELERLRRQTARQASLLCNAADKVVRAEAQRDSLLANIL